MKKLIVFLTSALVLGVMPFSTSVVLAIGATTNPATNITQAGATLSGTVVHASGEYITAIAVAPTSSFSEPFYAYSGACDPASQIQVVRGSVFDVLGGSGASNVSWDFTYANASCVMKPQTTYYFKVGIQDPVNNNCIYSMSCYTWGATSSFTTRAAILPSATTEDATEVGPDSARLNSTTSATDGNAAISYEYGTSATLAGAKTLSLGTKYPAGSGYGGIGPSPVMGSGVVTGLIESTKYYFRVIATSAYGTVRGEIKSFTTRPPVGISINSASEFTRTTGVSISVSWPVNAESMLVSNDGGFRTQQSFALAEELNWTLLSSGDERLPKTVYLKFVMTDGSRSSIYADDIILDTTAPVLTQASATTVNSSAGVSVAAARKNAVRLKVTTSDANSGIDHLEVKSSVGGIPALVSIMKTGKVTTSVILKTAKRSFLVRAIDRAGNPSTKWVKVVTKG